MEIRYTDRAREWEPGYSLLQQATAQLEEVIGAPAARVRAEWDRIEDERARPLYTLRISDWTGSAQTRFAPEELTFPAHTRTRLHRLWGDLLQVRSDAQHRKVEELVKELEGG
jgi:hypothetical protein